MAIPAAPRTSPSVVRRWPPTEAAVGQARAALRTVLDAWNLAEVIEPATLVLSELMTNALRHADGCGDDIEIRCEPWGNGGVRLEVLDGDPAHLPCMKAGGTEAEQGRGLHLVQVVTNGRWGTDLAAGVGKRVWANVPKY